MLRRRGVGHGTRTFACAAGQATARPAPSGCIEAKFCNKICVGKLSPRSTQCTPLHSSVISFFLSKCLPNFCKISKISEIFRKFGKILAIFRKKCDLRAVQRSALCRSRRELSNAYLLAKFGFDTAENEPCQVERGGRFCKPSGAGGPEQRQTLEGSFSAVSKPNFASKYAFESSRRDLHNALLCTALQSQFFVKICQKSWQKSDKKLRLQSCAKECIV